MDKAPDDVIVLDSDEDSDDKSHVTLSSDTLSSAESDVEEPAKAAEGSVTSKANTNISKSDTKPSKTASSASSSSSSKSGDEADKEDTSDDDEDYQTENDSEPDAFDFYKEPYKLPNGLQCFDLRDEDPFDDKHANDDPMETDKPDIKDDDNMSENSDYSNISDAFAEMEVGANDIEEQERQTLALFERSQQLLTKWEAEPNSEFLRNEYFGIIHDLTQSPAFSRLHQIPGKIDWTVQRRLEDSNKSPSPVLIAFYKTHYQLSQILHNPVDSYLQVLIITPSRTDLWYELGRVAAEKGDWKSAELAYCRFAQFSSDSLKGLQPLALLHFVSADYLKCLRIIKQIFTKQPSNIIGNVLIEELSHPNALGGRLETAMNMIGVTRWDKPPPAEYRKEILQRIADFRSKLDIPCVQCEENSCVERIYRLEIRESDALFENFAKRLLDIAEEFDEKPSLPISLECVENTEVSPKKKRRTESPEPKNVTEPDNHVPEIPPDLSEPMSVEVIEDYEPADPVIRAILDEIIQTVLTDEITPPNSVNAVGSQTEEEENESGNGKRNKKRTKTGTVPRRSTRFVEDVDDQPFSRPAVQKQIWSVADCLSVPRNYELKFPTEFHKSVETPQTMEESNVEAKTDRILLTDFLNSLMSEVNASWEGLLKVEDLIERLLKFVAKTVTHERMNFSETDRNLLLALYSRWSATNDAVESMTLSIHLLAAELDQKEATRRVAAVLRSHLVSGSDKSELHCAKCSSFAENIDPLNGSQSNGSQRQENFKPMEESKIAQISDPALRRVVITAHRIFEEKRRQPLREPQNHIASSHDELIAEPLGPIFVRALRNLGIENVDDPLLPPIYSPGYYNPSESADSLDDLTNEEVRRATIRFLYSQARQHHSNTTPSGRRLENHKLRELAIAVESLLDVEMPVDLPEKSSTSEEYDNGCGFGVGVLCDVEWIARRLVGISRETKTTELTVRVGEFEDIENQSAEYMIELLVLHHDWQNDSVDQKLRHLNILYRCHKIRFEFGPIMSRLLLDHPRKSRYFITENLRGIVEELDTNLADFLDTVSHSSVCALLVMFAERSIFREHLPLWKLAYRLAALNDPKTVDEFENYFDSSAEVRDRLPTPSLMLLREAHEILAADKCCGIEEGAFLRFMLAELCRIGRSKVFRNAVDDSQHDVSDITQNVEIELYQLLSCAFGIHLSSRRPKVGEHSTDCHKEIDWETIRRILPFVWPRQFPLFDDNAAIRQDTVELFKNLEPIILKQLNDEKIEEFVKFRKNHCSYDPDFNIDANQHMIPLNPMHKSPAGELLNLNNWPSIKAADETEADAEQRHLSARVLYVLLISRYRQSSGGKSVDEKTPICVLLFGRDALPDDLLGSVWMIIAKQGSDILQETDTATLCNRLNEVLFPFRMSLLLKRDVAEAHLDMGLLMYQIHARIERICRERNAIKTVRDAVLRFLRQSARHFQLSEVYKTDAIDLSWLMSYFRGKVAEKTAMRSSIAEVLGFYTECTHRLAADQYVFLAKISRKTQNHFEPLEIHYRVHAFVQKRRKHLMKKPKADSLKELRQMYNHLEHFALYGVSKQSAPSRFFRLPSEVIDCVESLVWTVGQQSQSNQENEKNTLDNLTEMVDLNERVDKLLLNGYESILAKFPHYKAAYRLAEMNFERHKYAGAADILFSHVFPSKKKNNPLLSIFEGLVEIRRSDFERSRSMDYHLERLVTLLSRCLSRSYDLERLGMVLNSLLILNTDKEEDFISTETRKRMVEPCLRRFNDTATHMLRRSPGAVSIDRRLLANIERLMTLANVGNAKLRDNFAQLNVLISRVFTERENKRRSDEQRRFQQQQQREQQKAVAAAAAVVAAQLKAQQENVQRAQAQAAAQQLAVLPPSAPRPPAQQPRPQPTAQQPKAQPPRPQPPQPRPQPSAQRPRPQATAQQPKAQPAKPPAQPPQPRPQPAQPPQSQPRPQPTAQRPPAQPRPSAPTPQSTVPRPTDLSAQAKALQQMTTAQFLTELTALNERTLQANAQRQQQTPPQPKVQQPQPTAQQANVQRPESSQAKKRPAIVQPAARLPPQLQPQTATPSPVAVQQSRPQPPAPTPQSISQWSTSANLQSAAAPQPAAQQPKMRPLQLPDVLNAMLAMHARTAQANASRPPLQSQAATPQPNLQRSPLQPPAAAQKPNTPQARQQNLTPQRKTQRPQPNVQPPQRQQPQPQRPQPQPQAAPPQLPSQWASSPNATRATAPQPTAQQPQPQPQTTNQQSGILHSDILNILMAMQTARQQTVRPPQFQPQPATPQARVQQPESSQRSSLYPNVTTVQRPQPPAQPVTQQVRAQRPQSGQPPIPNVTPPRPTTVQRPQQHTAAQQPNAQRQRPQPPAATSSPNVQRSGSRPPAAAQQPAAQWSDAAFQAMFDLYQRNVTPQRKPSEQPGPSTSKK